MINNVLGDGFEPVLAFDDLNFRRELVLQLRLLRVVQVLILDNLGKLFAQILVLNQDLWDALFVKQRHGRAVVHGLLEIVF